MDSYFNGLIQKHYHPIVPLVSDTGAYIPEAPLFSAATTLAGVLCKYTYPYVTTGDSPRPPLPYPITDVICQ